MQSNRAAELLPFLQICKKQNFRVGVSCRILYSFVVYLYVSGSGSITSVGEERKLICLDQLLFTCNYVVSVRRDFLFLWVLGMGYAFLLWHSLSLPYNYFSYNTAQVLCGWKGMSLLWVCKIICICVEICKDCD